MASSVVCLLTNVDETFYRRSNDTVLVASAPVIEAHVPAAFNLSAARPPENAPTFHCDILHHQSFQDELKTATNFSFSYNSDISPMESKPAGTISKCCPGAAAAAAVLQRCCTHCCRGCRLGGHVSAAGGTYQCCTRFCCSLVWLVS
jgi:hypothetical protein